MTGGWGAENQASLPSGSRIIIIILSSHWHLVRTSAHKALASVSHLVSFSPPNNHNSLDTAVPTLEGEQVVAPGLWTRGTGWPGAGGPKCVLPGGSAFIQGLFVVLVRWCLKVCDPWCLRSVGARSWKTVQGVPADLHLCPRPRHAGALLSFAEVPGKKPHCSSRDRKTCAFDGRT